MLTGVPVHGKNCCSGSCFTLFIPSLLHVAIVAAVLADTCGYPLLSVFVGILVFSWKWISWGLSTRSILSLWHSPQINEQNGEQRMAASWTVTNQSSSVACARQSLVYALSFQCVSGFKWCSLLLVWLILYRERRYSCVFFQSNNR